MCLLVVIFAVSFKLSLSMLFFLIIYMYFYYTTHVGVLQYIEDNKFYESISTKMLEYKQKFLVIKEKNNQDNE